MRRRHDRRPDQESLTCSRSVSGPSRPAMSADPYRDAIIARTYTFPYASTVKKCTPSLPVGALLCKDKGMLPFFPRRSPVGTDAVSIGPPALHQSRPDRPYGPDRAGTQISPLSGHAVPVGRHRTAKSLATQHAPTTISVSAPGLALLRTGSRPELAGRGGGGKGPLPRPPGTPPPRALAARGGGVGGAVAAPEGPWRRRQQYNENIHF